MLKKAANPEQLKILRRLRSAGCPVDSEHLPQPPSPLRDFRQAGVQGTNVIPIAGGYGIVLGIKALSCATVTVCHFDLRANWFKGSISWLQACDEHPNHYCFQKRSGAHLEWSSGNVLTRMTWLLKRGDYLEGRLFGALHEPLPSTLPRTLEATLSIADLAGNEYHFPLSLLNGLPQTVLNQPIGEF